MAKFDKTQFDCSDSANLDRWSQIKNLISDIECYVASTCSGVNSSGTKARKYLKLLKQQIAILYRTIQIANNERAKARKAAKKSKEQS